MADPQDFNNPLKGWHFRKEFHAGHIITTVAMIVAATMAWSDLKSASEEQERRLLIVENRMERDDTPQRLARIEAILDEISRRLDRRDRDDRE